MASPFPFTSGQVLTAAQLNSIGEATAFTPSWNNVTVGNAVESWYYTQVNDLVIVQGVTELGSTSAITGSISLDHPTGSAVVSSGMACGFTFLEDANGTDLFGTVQLNSGNVTVRAWAVTGSDITFSTVNATNPFTWATGDQLHVSYMYQLS